MRKLFQNSSSFKPLGQLKPNYPGMLILTVSVYFIYNIIVITLPLVGPLFELKYLILSNTCGKVLIARVSLNSAYIFFQIRMKPAKVCKVIIACAVLHNIAIMRKEPLDEQDEQEDAQPQMPPFDGQQDGRGIRDHFANTFFLKIKHLVLIVWSTSICFEVFWYQYKSKNQIMYEWWDKRYCFFIII